MPKLINTNINAFKYWWIGRYDKNSLQKKGNKNEKRIFAELILRDKLK